MIFDDMLRDIRNPILRQCEKNTSFYVAGTCLMADIVG